MAFADAAPRQLEVTALADYASERENPANIKRVFSPVVELPARLLESGVTLVDTPGLGSLATSGAAETLAYLPHCDVAAVLVDAGSTITVEDLATVGLLLNAGIRVSVLVSKADLIGPADREAVVAYAREALAREFNVPIAVVAGASGRSSTASSRRGGPRNWYRSSPIRNASGNRRPPARSTFCGRKSSRACASGCWQQAVMRPHPRLSERATSRCSERRAKSPIWSGASTRSRSCCRGRLQP